MTNKVLALIGPSGSGKTTIGNLLKKEGIPEIISYTTRAPRQGEIQDVSYHFVSEEDFNKLDKVEETIYAGARYATAKQDILSCIPLQYVVITYSGMEEIRKNCPESQIISVFIDVPKEVCIQRMKDRGDSEENINNRIKNFDILDEFSNRNRCDYIFNNATWDTNAEIKKLLHYIQNL